MNPFYLILNFKIDFIIVFEMNKIIKNKIIKNFINFIYKEDHFYFQI